MRRLLVVIAVPALVMSVPADILEACGAKFLVATRAARFQKMQRAASPATILLFQHSDRPADNPADVAELAEKMRTILEHVGHTVTVVDNEDALRARARDAAFNVVMMELDTARRLRSDIGALAPNAHVLPVGSFLTTAQAAAAKEEFGEVVRIPGSDSQMLASVQGSYSRN
jgi:CheY-like chemotaxis protein